MANREKIGDFIVDVLFACAAIMIFSIMCLMVVWMGDVLTSEKIGEESVPCLDEYNRPFENEMCTKTLYCSWLGLAAEERCAHALEGEQDE